MSRNKIKRGGIRDWSIVRKDITNHLNGDNACYSTTMVDYYALPLNWPGRAKAIELPFPKKIPHIQKELSKDICLLMGKNFNPSRFIPYVMMHEFEGLLFSNCTIFANAIGQPDIASEFQMIRNQFTTPEEINDSPTTAPSKRIENLVPEYQKPLHGNLAILEIGLNNIRSECPFFHLWVTSLENLK